LSPNNSPIIGPTDMIKATVLSTVMSFGFFISLWVTTD
jgi:hypothetical protein